MIPRPTWLGNFYGGNLGFLNYEILTIQHIPHADLKREVGLMDAKWFDYRRLHPMQATYYLVRCYNDAYQAFVRKAIDAAKAPFMRGIKDHDFLNSKEKMTFWRLRQNLDQYGLPYDFFLTFAMGWHYRTVANGKIYAPRPNHFVKNEELFADAILAWEEQCKTSLRISSDPYYRASNFTGSKDQIAHEAFVIGQIKQRRLPQYSLHAAMYLFDVVRIEEALRQFDQRIVDSAIQEVVIPITELSQH